jgi:lysozyme
MTGDRRAFASFSKDALSIFRAGIQMMSPILCLAQWRDLCKDLAPMRAVLLFSLVVCPCLVRAADVANNVLSLSHYDEQALDFNSLQRGGVDGIIHEATYPPFDRDPKYAVRQNAAVQAGIRWGSYHFGNATDGRKQADHYLEFVSSKWAESSGATKAEGVLLVLDAEQNTHYPGGSMTAEQAVRFVDRVHERTGVYPGFYSNENWAKRLVGNADESTKQTLSKCWLWIANYHYQPAVPSLWSKWTFWQYTGDGTCGLPRNIYPTGVAGLRKVERTIFGADRAAMRGFWSAHAWHPAG